LESTDLLSFAVANNSGLLAVIPIVVYDNADIQKEFILKENKDKSGIYCWTNKINGKSYVGSSVDLYLRFLKYFNTNELVRHYNMVICRALLKHGYSNFSLTIIEYCEPVFRKRGLLY